MSKFFKSLADPKVWRTILVNAAALAPVASGYIGEPWGALIIAAANVVNHMFNSAQAASA